MNRPIIVIDTNVLVSGLRSREGASFQLLERIPSGDFEIVVSVPLVMEYESVLLRPGLIPLSATQLCDVLDYVCALARNQPIHFLWRPTLPDPKDDMVLELAVNAGADAIVTHNTRDFLPALNLGIPVKTPREFLMNQQRSQP